MSQVRQGEVAKRWFRSARVFKMGTAWWVATRDAGDIGPFGSEREATQGAQVFGTMMSNPAFKADTARNTALYGHRPMDFAV